jgi:peptidoglycan-associated lipoprotein
LAVANNLSNEVSILLGNGDGTFGAATNYAAGTGPTSIADGDFNGDGKPDLAVANGAGNNVSIFLNTGIGTFGAATNYAAGSNPTSVAIGDLDGDGKPDLAVANGADNNVSIFLNTGTGTFGAAMNYSAGSNPTSVAVGDFSGDGVPDLAVANGAGNNVSILPGKGTGTFGTATNYSAGSNPSSIASGDFNPDGKLDLAVVNNSSNEVSILLGTGTGTFYLQSKTNFSCAQDRNFTKEYDYISGTSFAASFVAGIAGLLLIQDPSLTPPDLKAILVSTVDAKNSLKGALISAGRVNANRALTRDLGATFSGGQRESVACGRIDPGGDGPASPGTGAASLLVMALPMLLASRSVRKVLQRGRWSLFFFVIIAPLPVQHWMSTAVYAQTPEDTQMTHQLALKMGFHLYRSSQYFNTNAAFFDEKDLTSVAEELEYDYLWFSPSSLALAVGYYDGRTDFKTICCSEIKFSNLYALATLKFHIKPVKLKPLEFYFGPGLGYNHFERRITVLNTSDSITRRAFDLHFVVGAQMRLGTRLSLILESRYASATIDNANNLDDKLNIGGLTTFLGVAWQYPDLRHFFPTRIAEPSEQMAGLKPAEVTEERVIPPVEKPLEERPEPEEKVPVGVGPTAELGLNEIHFGYDDWIIAEKERSILENDARWLQTHPDVKVVLEGHCDERGTNEYNLALGQRRAEAVKRVLITLGISESRLSVVSYGEERPVCFEETEECFAKNRRVQFTTQ